MITIEKDQLTGLISISVEGTLKGTTPFPGVLTLTDAMALAKSLNKAIASRRLNPDTPLGRPRLDPESYDIAQTMMPSVAQQVTMVSNFVKSQNHDWELVHFRPCPPAPLPIVWVRVPRPRSALRIRPNLRATQVVRYIFTGTRWRPFIASKDHDLFQEFLGGLKNSL